MTGTNSSSDRLILHRNVEIYKFQWISFMRRNFPGMKSSTTWLGNVIAQSPRKCRDISNTYNIRTIMVYRMIIDVILHLFITCYDLRCQLPFFLKKSFRHNGSAVFGKMPQMLPGCKQTSRDDCRDFETRSAFHVVCTTQRVTRDGVPMLANPFNWRVRWPRPARVPLFSLWLGVHVATAGGC